MGTDKATVSALSGDPRRPDLAVPYKRPPPSEDKVDVLATGAMLLGLIGMLTKVRLFSFISIAFIASSFVQSGPDTDLKQLMMSAMFSVVGLFFPHFQPVRPSRTNATEAAPASGSGQT